MNGFVYSVLPGASAVPTYGLLAGRISGTYSALGVTDINGDGLNDLLVREANTGSILWRNTADSVWAYVGINLGSNWRYQAAGDVNRDGFSNVIIRDTSGLVYIANMANGVNSGYISLGNLAGYPTGKGGSGWQTRNGLNSRIPAQPRHAEQWLAQSAGRSIVERLGIDGLA